jgi:dienelactone hydrolase
LRSARTSSCARVTGPVCPRLAERGDGERTRVAPRWTAAVVAGLALFAGACARRSAAPPADGRGEASQASVAPGAALDRARAAALEAIGKARAAKLGEVARAISLPSIERLVDDADAVRAHVTNEARDLAFVRRSFETARGYADVLGNGEDPYDYARGAMVKAYRAGWDGTLQPYALYVPRDYDASRAWPLVVALHGAHSNHRHMLRRVFGLDNRPGENDEEASRNELPFPDVPALVVAPFGRGELMGYDGLGQEDVLRVIADVKRAYKVDQARVSLTGLSMGGGGTWTIGLEHPELFSALAPVCGVTDTSKWIPASQAADYDPKALEAMSPPAFAENAERLRVFIFHGDADPVVPVEDSRRMAARFKALGWLGKTVTYTEYPGVDHRAWVPAYEGARLLKTLAEIKRDPKAPARPRKPVPADRAWAALFGKSVPREHPHLYVYEGGDAARAFATKLADWGPGIAARFTVKPLSALTDDEKRRFELVVVSVRGQGPPASRSLVPSPHRPGHLMLTFEAASPEGLARLARFAAHNADHWAPESNRAVTSLSQF